MKQRPIQTFFALRSHESWENAKQERGGAVAGN